MEHASNDGRNVSEIPVRCGNGNVFVGNLDQGGLTVVVHHGMGLYTWYYGLSETWLEQGDVVSKGEVLGSVWAQEEDAWFGVQAVFQGVPLNLQTLQNQSWLELEA